jgi:predicted transcriptional regulator
MTERLDEKLRAAKIVLEKLKYGPTRWTPLVKTVINESPSPWKAQTILEWLLKHGYIERPERGVYNITEKGRNLLKSLY